MIGPDELTDDLRVALRLADLASAAILPLDRRSTAGRKPDGSEVTAADLAAERAIRDHLAVERPDDGIIGEEFGAQAPRPGNPRRWVIDPLDGTAFFALGLPSYSTLIALLDGDEPMLGVIHLPATGETTYAARGLGCWWRPGPGAEPERVRVADPVPLREAFAAVTHAMATDLLASEGKPRYRLTELARSIREFRHPGDSIKHALLCRGRLHLAVDTVMFPWDVAALVPCVEEAGGVVASLTVDRPRIVFGGTIVSACDPAMLAEVLELLRPERDRDP